MSHHRGGRESRIEDNACISSLVYLYGTAVLTDICPANDAGDAEYMLAAAAALLYYIDIMDTATIAACP